MALHRYHKGGYKADVGTVMKTHLVLGGPGCGKTTRLIEILEEHLKDKVPPNRIAYVAFTNAAADEASDRVRAKFMFKSREMEFFATIHSMCFRALGLNKSQVLGPEDWKIIGKLLGHTIKGFTEATGDMMGSEKGDRLLFASDYMRCAKMTITQVCAKFSDKGQFSKGDLVRFIDHVELYKDENGKLDFTDMLVDFIKHCDPLPVDIAIIDEAQDLNKLQWDVVEYAFRDCRKVYVGGDDDQAIYEWSGADVNKFLHLDATQEVLPHSWRLPIQIWEVAQEIVGRILERYVKEYTSSLHPGSVTEVNSVHQIDMSKGQWMLIARNGYMLANYCGWLEHKGYPYVRRGKLSIMPQQVTAIQGWEAWRKGEKLDSVIVEQVIKYHPRNVRNVRKGVMYLAEDFGFQNMSIWHEELTIIPANKRRYYVACLKNGERIQDHPRIQINTIHAVKGKECDNVVVGLDISHRCMDEYQLRPSPEHRVFYVAVTRAKQHLFVIAPQTNEAYKI